MSWQHWIESRGVPLSTDRENLFLHYKGLARYLGIRTERRYVEIVMTRYLFWEEVVERGMWSLTKVGNMTGHDHSTVINGLRRMRELREVKDAKLRGVEIEYQLKKQEYATWNSL